MDTRRKTIEELERKRDETVHELLGIYGKIGRGLLVKQLSDVSQEKIQAFDGMNAFRRTKNDEITAIQTASADKQELTDQIAIIKTQIGEFESQKESKLEDLGTALFRHYDVAMESCFGSFHVDAENEEKNLIAHETKASEILKEMETQGFFAKLVTQVKLLSANTAVSHSKKRLLSVVSAGAQAVLDAKTLDSAVESGLFNPAVIVSYRNAQALNQEILGQREYSKSLSDKMSKVQSKLNTLGAGNNPERKIEQIRADIHAKDAEQEKLCVDVGYSLANEYIAPDGGIISSYEKYDIYLFDEIVQKRILLTSYNRRVEILEISGKIEVMDKKRILLVKNVSDMEEKIHTLQESIVQVTGDIVTLTAEKESLAAKRSSLELIEGKTTKLLTTD